jgi:drug/metabolite transporter (DMT)-like permease
MSDKRRGELSLLTAAILYGFFGVLAKIIRFDIPIFYQSWVRNFFATILLVALMVLLKKGKRVERKDIKWFFLRTFCGFVSFISLYSAFTGVDIGTAYFSFYAATVVSGFIVGRMFFGERVKRTAIFSLILSVIGLSLIFTARYNTERIYFIALAFLSGLVLPGWNIFSKKISHSYSNLQCNVIDSIFAAILPLIMSLILHERWTPIQLNVVWAEIFFLGLMFVAVGFLIVYGFKHVKAQEGTLILLFEVIAGMLFAYLFFHEAVSLQSFIGGAMIMGAIILRNYTDEV